MILEPRTREPEWPGSAHLAYLLPVLFVVAVAVLCGRLPNFEFDPDEGGNLMKALLVQYGHPLYTEIWSDQPPLFTHALAWLFRLTGPSVASGRWLVMISSGLLLWGAFQYLRLTTGTVAAAGGLVLIAGLPLFVTLSMSVMIGLPSLALAMLALAALAHWRSRGSPWLLAASAGFLALSVLTKGFTLVLVPAFAAGMLMDRDLGCLRRRAAMLLLWVAMFGAVALAVTCLLVGPRSLGMLLKPHLAARDLAAYQGFTLVRAVRPARYLLELAVAGGLLARSRHNRAALYPLFWMFAGILALAFHRPVWPHQHLLVSLPAALLAAEIFSTVPWFMRCLREQGVRRWRRSVAVVLAILVLAMIGAQLRRTYRLSVRWLERRDRALQSEDWRLTAAMAGHAGTTRWVVTDRPMYAFRASLLVPPEMAVVSEKRLRASLSGDAWMLACIERYRPEQVALGRFPWPVVRPYLEARYVPVHGLKTRNLFLDSWRAPR